MVKLIIGLIIQLIVIAPLIVIALDRSEYKWKHLFLFVLYFFLYMCLLAIPNWFPELRIVKSAYHLNWSGKIYAITGSLLFYNQFRKVFANYDYITFKQNNNSLKLKFFITTIVFLVAIGLAFLSIKHSDESLQYFLFQFTMPGLDEELAFRGIMLGLLSNSLKLKIHIGSINLGNPALLITSILFGLGHSIHIDDNWSLYQNWFEFINVFLIGLFLGWLTIKFGSILMSILTHNLINTLPQVLVWI